MTLLNLTATRKGQLKLFLILIVAAFAFAGCSNSETVSQLETDPQSAVGPTKRGFPTFRAHTLKIDAPGLLNQRQQTQARSELENIQRSHEQEALDQILNN